MSGAETVESKDPGPCSVWVEGSSVWSTKRNRNLLTIDLGTGDVGGHGEPCKGDLGLGWRVNLRRKRIRGGGGLAAGSEVGRKTK